MVSCDDSNICEDCGKNVLDGDECSNDNCSCFGMMVCECHECDG